jgi:hypothetical protein
MKRHILPAVSLVILIFFLTGCGILNKVSFSNRAENQTATDNSIAAIKVPATEKAPAVTSAVPASESQQPSAIPLPSGSTLSPTPTSIDYLISAVEDVTIPDGDTLSPGENIVKTWRLTNGGLSLWPAETRLVFVSGDQMGAEAVMLQHPVAPGQTVEVSVNLQTPTTEGAYQGYFMLQTDTGKLFGVGKTGTDAFWVKIAVKEFFQVTSARVKAFPEAYTGACPGMVTLTAEITTTLPGEVTYYFITTSGNSPTYTLSFAAAGTITSSPITWPVTGPDPLAVSIYIDFPNHQEFSSVTIPITCN